MDEETKAEMARLKAELETSKAETAAARAESSRLKQLAQELATTVRGQSKVMTLM